MTINQSHAILVFVRVSYERKIETMGGPMGEDTQKQVVEAAAITAENVESTATSVKLEPSVDDPDVDFALEHSLEQKKVQK